MRIVLFCNGNKSVLSYAWHPPDQVTAAYIGNSLCAASAAFSPSTINTGASGRCASRSNPYSGLGLLNAPTPHARGPCPDLLFRAVQRIVAGDIAEQTAVCILIQP